MTKIKIYPIDTNISGSDKWIGSDANSFNRTKNFTVAGISDYYNSTSSVNMANAITFRYDTVDIGDDRASGSFSFETEVGATVPFSSITELMFSKNTSNGKYIVDLMNYYNGNLIYVNKSGDPDIFAIYRVTSYEQNLVETDFYDTTLQFINGNGSIEEDELYFVSLLQISTEDSDKHYTHVQGVAASTWRVNHNLDKYPSATMVLSTGQKGYGDVSYIDENILTITFASAESGKAYIN